MFCQIMHTSLILWYANPVWDLMLTSLCLMCMSGCGADQGDCEVGSQEEADAALQRHHD